MRRAFDGPAWCGSALREVLADVTAEEAAARPLPRSLSIWQMALHLAAWKGVVRQRVGGEHVELPAEGDFPPVPDATEDAWRATLELLERRHRELQETVAALPDSRLDETVAGSLASVYMMLHGILQHDLYHGSQMALLKKAQRQPSVAQ
jgi:uncharacterized damage-inducible protein DinB